MISLNRDRDQLKYGACHGLGTEPAHSLTGRAWGLQRSWLSIVLSSLPLVRYHRKTCLSPASQNRSPARDRLLLVVVSQTRLDGVAIIHDSPASTKLIKQTEDLVYAMDRDAGKLLMPFRPRLWDHFSGRFFSRKKPRMHGPCSMRLSGIFGILSESPCRQAGAHPKTPESSMRFKSKSLRQGSGVSATSRYSRSLLILSSLKNSIWEEAAS